MKITFSELIPQIELDYRAMTKVQSGEAKIRAIAGQSMGGYGALYLCFSTILFQCSLYQVLDLLIFQGYIQNHLIKKLDNTFSRIWGKKTKEGSFEYFRENSILKSLN